MQITRGFPYSCLYCSTRECSWYVCGGVRCVICDVMCGAGILRNLAFESVALRKEIIAFGGVEALLKVRCPSRCYLN